MPPTFEQYESLVDGYGKHPDQGLKATKKKLSKDPNNAVLLLAQTRFLQRLGRDEEALNSCNSICDSVKSSSKDALEIPLIVEIQDITAECQEALGTFCHVGGAKLSGLWKDVLDQTPKYRIKKVYEEMYRVALSNEYWDIAQQLFARLQKENPKLSQYHYAWVALSQMQAENLPTDDRMGQNLKLLAFRSLKAAVENTIAKKDTPRTITSASELRLVAEIYRKQGFDEELLGILNSDDIGIESSVGKNDVEFIRAKIDILKRLERWEELASLCASSLDKLCQQQEQTTSAAEDIPTSLAWADDWYIWENAIVSRSKSRLAGSDINSLLKRYLTLKTKNRNAGRASLLNQSINNKSGLFNECKRFFELHKSSRSCFEDLRQFLLELSEDERVAFVSHAAATSNLAEPPTTETEKASKWTLAAVSSLKISYMLHISKSGDTDQSNEIKNFVLSCLKVYTFSVSVPTDSGDDASILAVMALLKLREDRKNLVKAAYLTEYLHAISSDNSLGTLLSLLVSQLLGYGSITISAFQQLGLREVQFDTLSHLLYSRISTFHPYSVELRSTLSTDDRYKDPFSGISFALQWPRKAISTTTNFMSKDLKNVYFDKIIEFSAFKERVETSFTPILLQLERRRVARLTYRSSTIMEESLVHFDRAKSDNRDFYSVPSFEHPAAESLDRLIFPGPRLSTYWLAWWTRNDLLQTIASSKSALPPTQQRILFDSIQFLKENASLKAQQLTEHELKVFEGWELMQPVTIHILLDAKSPQASKDLKKDFSLLSDFVGASRLAFTTLEAPVLPDWAYYHSRFLYLELFKAYDKLCDGAIAVSKLKANHAYGKIPVEVVLSIKKDSRVTGTLIQSQAKGLKQVLEKNGTSVLLGLLREDENGVGVALEELLRPDTVKAYTSKFLESVLESLDGILKVKL
ncbi:Tetratricopeptide-like helical [Venturia nashicola]|nr:Tetratricopeptide-like helical [Venturia nashicola]